MTWRLAKSLEKLRAQINEKYPNRSKASDGTIGDAAHASRSSDHNPWVRDGRIGVVTGMDLTHDPARGLDSEQLAEAFRAARDPRIKYVISNKKIFSALEQPWKWRIYNGKNPHNHHVHISVKADKANYDDTSDWMLDVAPPLDRPHPVTRPTLRRGMAGDAVKELQTALGFTNGQIDGDFGSRTEAAVRARQLAARIVPDGVVGPHTWEILTAKGQSA